ncbi:MAG: MFS transporter, partial [Gammaproteobacteria bacterium]
PITWTRLIVDWFDAGRGRALGIALAGTGVSATFIPIYATWLITEFGWRMTYIGLAALPALIALPLSYFFLYDRTGHSAKAAKHRQPQLSGMEFGEVLKGYRFWALNVAFVMVGMCIAGLIAHLIPMLTDRNVPATTAAQVAGTIGISVIVGRIGTGYLIDRFWAPAVGVAVLSLPALSCVVLAVGYGGIPGALFAAVLVGLAAGAEFDLMSFLVTRYFGQRRYGLIYSCLYAVFKLSAGIGAPLFGLSFDLTGSYEFILYCAAGSLIGGSLLMLLLGPYRVDVKN